MINFPHLWLKIGLDYCEINTFAPLWHFSDFSPSLSVRFLQACRDFLDLAETHSRRWQRALQYEREQRTHLEETIEQLAKQHNSLERAWREAPTLASSTPSAATTTQSEFESEGSFCVDFTFLAKVTCDLRLNIMVVFLVEEKQSFELN